MMFALVPALRAPTVTTAVSVPATSRETRVCSRITVAAAMTTGSTVASGRDPCPPAPWRVTLSESDAANAGPLRRPSMPAGIGATCWPSTTSGRGTRVNRSSSTIDLRPAHRLLGGLEEEEHGSAPGVAGRGEAVGGAEQAGDVHVVAAGVHDALDRRWRTAGPVVSVTGRASMSARSSTVGPGAVAQDADDTGAADALDHVVAQVAQPGRDDAGRAVLLPGQLGMGVQVAVDSVSRSSRSSMRGNLVEAPHSRWATTLTTVPSGARTWKRRTPQLSVVSGWVIS